MNTFSSGESGANPELSRSRDETFVSESDPAGKKLKRTDFGGMPSRVRMTRNTLK